MKLVVRSTILFKAKKVPIGTRHKWHDGTYVKDGDHEWHKEHLTAAAHWHLAENSKKKDPQVKKEFTTAVHKFADFLVKKDIHPYHIPPKDLHAFWSEAIGDKNYHKDAGWKKYVKLAVDSVKSYHSKLSEDGFERNVQVELLHPHLRKQREKREAKQNEEDEREERRAKARQSKQKNAREPEKNDEDEHEKFKNYTAEHFLTQRAGTAKRKKALRDKTKKLAADGKYPWQD